MKNTSDLSFDPIASVFERDYNTIYLVGKYTFLFGLCIMVITQVIEVYFGE